MSLSTPWIALALVLLAFGATLPSSFHFDDYHMLADPGVTAPSGWWEVFRLERTRPLTYLTFWANYAIGGQDPWGYHLVNLLVHLGTVWLAWLVFRKVLPETAATIGVLVFALHPLQTEAVAYVFARATLLGALFCVLCWLAWIKGRAWVSAVCFAAALLAKEEAIAFPVFLAAYEFLYAPQGRGELAKRRAPMAAMLVIAIAAGTRLLYAASVTEGSGLAFDLGEITPGTYLLTQGRAFWEYMRLLLFPIGLNFDPDFRLSTSLDTATGVAWAALVLLAALAMARACKHPALFWLLGGLILLAPSSSVVPLADLMAERRMYLPMLSFSAGIGMLLMRTHWLASAVVILVLTALSAQRAQTWRTEESLWRDTAEKSPRKARPLLQLARALGASGAGQHDEQFRRLQQAQSAAPGDPEVTTELGVFHLQQGDAAKALAAFEAALVQGAAPPQALVNRGAALFMLGRREEALTDFQAALDHDPCSFEARNNLIHARRAQDDGASVRRLALVPEGCRFTEEQRRALEALRPGDTPHP